MKKVYKLSISIYGSFYMDNSPDKLNICTDVIGECFNIFKENIEVKFSTIRPHKKGWKLVRLVSVDKNGKEVNFRSMDVCCNKYVKICNKTYPLTDGQFELINKLNIDRFWMLVI